MLGTQLLLCMRSLVFHAGALIAGVSSDAADKILVIVSGRVKVPPLPRGDREGGRDGGREKEG